MTEQPDDFIVGPRFPLTGAQAEAFRAGVMAGLQKGAGRERAAIVAWLHSCGDGICAECNANADLIESGEHLGAADE